MWATLRPRLLTAAAIVAAVLLWYGLVSGRVERTRGACIDRGGTLLIDLDARGVTFVQWCVLPDGTRELI